MASSQRPSQDHLDAAQAMAGVSGDERGRAELLRLSIDALWELHEALTQLPQLRGKTPCFSRRMRSGLHYKPTASKWVGRLSPSRWRRMAWCSVGRLTHRFRSSSPSRVGRM